MEDHGFATCLYGEALTCENAPGEYAIDLDAGATLLSLRINGTDWGRPHVVALFGEAEVVNAENAAFDDWLENNPQEPFYAEEARVYQAAVR